MEQRVDILTLATADLDAARRFYRDGLGWSPLLDVPDEIVFFQVAPRLVLGLFRADRFRADLGGTAAEPSLTGITLSHNVASPDAVDETVRAAVRAGARLVKPPQRADFGGYHGHVADPNGVIWEICHNPGWRVDPDGRVHLEEIPD
ncbi:hypothetical protein SAMN05421810_104132 [Amycolatopsis arida]|uniref:VOC domain-containing protein n=1 Tax=Amycolatopsis arida TaxID=587909 RepID=A0A1I5UW97_9PSEU|nr:VOC family protein [Amycolatopsis arida]TDX91051.1 hypothetical protein CLV69_106131 [Amycolatopsis arida]SFP99307.1 hypothetical protein SAMN05421810_104132 [Amycolatopsis arida]